jgi:hypothetical protein
VVEQQVLSESIGKWNKVSGATMALVEQPELSLADS